MAATYSNTVPPNETRVQRQAEDVRCYAWIHSRVARSDIFCPFPRSSLWMSSFLFSPVHRFRRGIIMGITFVADGTGMAEGRSAPGTS